MRRWRYAVLAAGCWGLTVPAASGQMLTERQALERMRLEHPQVQALRFTVREAEAGARERSLLSNPTVSYTREDAGLIADDFLVVQQELPLRGRLGLLGRAADKAAAAAESRADESRLALETRLRLAFTELLLAQERMRVLEADLTELRGLVDVLEARETEGEGSRYDRLRAEREVAEIETDLGAAAIGRLTAQARLAAFFAPGTEPAGLTAAGSLPQRPAVADVGTLVDQALSRRADYRALEHSETQWTIERRAAERLRLPNAVVAAGLKRVTQPTAIDQGYTVIATVGVPLFNRGQAQVARAEAARARTDAERQVLRTRIESEVRVAHAAVTGYHTLAERYRRESVEPATTLAAIAAAAHGEGEYTILERLDAHRVMLSARLRLLDLYAATRRAAIELDRAVGRRVTP